MRRQRPRRAGHGGGDRVDCEKSPPHRRADGAHATRVLANAVERAAERRMNDPPRDQEPDEQHHRGIDVSGFTKDIELEHAEDRIDLDALQPVIAAGKAACLIGVLEQNRHDRQRQHQKRHAGRVQNHRTGDQPEQRRNRDRREVTQDRVGRDVNRKQAGRVGANPKECRLPERHDAGVTEREIKRERKQDPDQNLGAEAEIATGHVEEDNNDGPGHRVSHECQPAVSGSGAEIGGRRDRGFVFTHGTPSASRLRWHAGPAAATAAARTRPRRANTAPPGSRNTCLAYR